MILGQFFGIGLALTLRGDCGTNGGNGNELQWTNNDGTRALRDTIGDIH